MKLRKWELFTKHFTYLAQEITPGKLQIHKPEWASLRWGSQLETMTELRSFVGICQVFRRIISGYSKVCSALYMMRKKGQPVKSEPFGEAEENTFEELIERVTNPPVLTLLRNDLLYSSDTDTSDQQIGAAILPEHKQSGTKIQPIAYWSRSLNEAENKYSTPQKKCLPIVFPLTTLRPYLRSRNFQLNTD